MSADSEAYLRSLAGDVSPRDVFSDYTQRFGKGATKQLASDFGISRAAAWRARTGRTRAPKFTATPKFRGAMDALARQMAAQRVRLSTTAIVGNVKVAYLDNPQGVRRMGRYSPLQLAQTGSRGGPGPTGQTLEVVARAIEAGEWSDAADTLDEVILNAYDLAAGGSGELGTYGMTIDEYTDGLELR